MPLPPEQSGSAPGQAGVRPESVPCSLAADDAPTARHPAAARSVHRPVRAWHSPVCREAVPEAVSPPRVAAAVAAEYRRQRAAARPVLTAAAHPWGTAKAAVPQSEAVREAALRPQEEVAAAAGAVGPPLGVPLAVAWQARRSAGPAVSAGQAAALPPEEPGARDAAGAVAAAPHGGAAVAVGAPREGEAAAVGAPREGEAVAVVAPREEAAGAVVAPHAEAAAAEVPRAEEEAAVAEAGQAAAALRRAAPAVAVGLPSAAAWAFRRDQVLPWPAPSPAVRFAHATATQSTASR